MASPWTPGLTVDFVAPFGRDERPDSPQLDPPAVGIRLAARDLLVEGGKATFTLLVTWALPLGVVAAYERIDWAVALFFEDAAGGRCAGKLLADPHRKYPPLSGPNYKGSVDPKKKGTDYGYRTLSLAVEVAPPAFHPSLFVRAGLREYVSNTLALDLAAQTVTTS